MFDELNNYPRHVKHGGGFNLKPMKGYFIEITNNLLDPKHQKAMKESVWLFMWLIDKMTSITEEGIGRVLGGKPIK